jgi:hypothetical protein
MKPFDRLSRRGFLRSSALGGAGLIGAYLLGCGDGDGEPAATATGAPTEPPSAATATAAPTSLRWRRIEPDGSLPSPRHDHSLVSDGDRLVLFGGRDASPLGDTWVYAVGANEWEQVAPGDAPAARFGHNAAWDRPSNRILLFGGQAGSEFFNDVWSFDPETWEWSPLLVNVNTPVPEGRYGAGAALDDTSRLRVSHGFTTSGRFDDTWRLDLAAMGWLDISPPDGEVRPLERCLVRAGWDAARARLLMFGGQSNEAPYLGDTWELTDEGWREIVADPAPLPRNLYAAAFDDASGTFLLYGGRSEAGPEGDLWYLDRDDLWHQVPIAGDAPAARHSHDAAWAASSMSLYVFGGNDGSADLNDLWVLSAT